MKNITIRLIVLLSSISLIGIIITQVFWIKNAIELSEEQFDHRVTIALKEVIGEVEKIIIKKNISKIPECKPSANSVFDLIDHNTLDSLLFSRFDYHCVNTIFSYEIRKCNDKSKRKNTGSILSDSFSTSTHKACLSCLWEHECFNLEVTFPKKREFVITEMVLWLGLSFIFIIIVIFSFAYIVSSIIKQKKLSEMKNNFVNNMTHEFKTPIATISMASEILLKTQDKSAHKYLNIISEENKRLQTQVERVLHVAILEDGSFSLDINEINVHYIIKNITDKTCLNYCEHDDSIKYFFEHDSGQINADLMHFKNIISNLVENAYKYSKENKEIIISTKNHNKGIIISVKDNGIGMSAETLKHIFNKFFRHNTGNIHDVKGFGLGLHYVKHIVEAHQGNVEVISELNKGSEFIVYLP